MCGCFFVGFFVHLLYCYDCCVFLFVVCFFFFFFFSSRRRHTRCLSDWSSDVCSSDLYFRHRGKTVARFQVPSRDSALFSVLSLLLCAAMAQGQSSAITSVKNSARSEERHVGKECRYGWSQYQ